MADYLRKIGNAVPPSVNPAEYMLDLVNKDFSEASEVDAVIAAWSTHGKQPLAPLGTSELGGARHLPGLHTQLTVLLRKHVVLSARDPMLYLGRMVAFLFSNTLFAVIYIRTRELNQQQALYRMFLIMWFGSCPTTMAMVAVYALNAEAKAIKREVKEGMYSPVAYVAVHTLIQLAAMLIMTLFALGIPAYTIHHFVPSQFIPVIFVFAVQLWAWECIAQFFSLAYANPLSGMLDYLNQWFTAYLYAGTVVNTAYVVYPFKILIYIFPFHWGYNALVYLEMHTTTNWDGAVECALIGAGRPGR